MTLKCHKVTLEYCCYGKSARKLWLVLALMLRSRWLWLRRWWRPRALRRNLPLPVRNILRCRLWLWRCWSLFPICHCISLLSIQFEALVIGVLRLHNEEPIHGAC